MRSIGPVLLDHQVSNYDKMRIIILYIISKNGISEENLNKVVQHGQLLPEEKRAISNLRHLGVNSAVSFLHFVDLFQPFQSEPNENFVFLQGSRKKVADYPRRERESEHKYQLSRWVPVIKDIMEDCIENKLDEKYFPFLTDRSKGSATYGLSQRFL